MHVMHDVARRLCMWLVRGSLLVTECTEHVVPWQCLKAIRVYCNWGFNSEGACGR